MLKSKYHGYPHYILWDDTLFWNAARVLSAVKETTHQILQALSYSKGFMYSNDTKIHYYELRYARRWKQKLW